MQPTAWHLSPKSPSFSLDDQENKTGLAALLPNSDFKGVRAPLPP